jgi:hypothetical protein
VGEVSWHEDAEIQKMWKTTFKQERHHVVPLPPDSGQWGVGLVGGAQIKALYQKLPAFIATLADEGKTGLEPAYLHPRDPLRLTAERLGISYLHRAADYPGPSHAMFFMPPSGGVVPPDAESVVEWVESVIADPAYRDVTAKLLKVPEMDERHVFIMSGSQTPFDVNERLSRISNVLPRRAPIVPPGITHVWVISRWTTPDAGSYAALWSMDDGWSLIAVQALDATVD